MNELGVALGWHSLAWEDLLAVTRHAEASGFASVYVDGDVSMLGKRHEADVLHGWTVTQALIARTRRIHIGSIRLVHHWHAAQLAQAIASSERIAPGRLRCFVGVGDRPEDPRFGLPDLPVAERIEWLDETLDAVRALWRGETVTRDGRFVRLDEARVRPVLGDARPKLELAAKGQAMLRLVARHADVWNANLPPIPDRLARARDRLDAACEAESRRAGDLSTRLWVFTRVQKQPDAAAALREFRRLNPWFAQIRDDEIASALVHGEADRCRDRLASLAADLGIEPVLDLSGLDADAARRHLDAFAESL